MPTPQRFAPGLLPSPRGLLTAALLTLALLAPGPAAAQTGQPFVAEQSWYADAFGLGIVVDGLGNLQVETDGVAGITAADHVHPVPADADQGLGSARNYRLSPSRRHLIIFGTTADFSGARLYVYGVPAADGAPLVPIATSAVFPDGFNGPWFHDTGVAGQPVFLHAVSLTGAWPLQRIWWLNLDSGIGGFTLDLAPPVDIITYAANGIAAFVKADGVPVGTATYRLINLCDDQLGNPYSQTGGFLQDLPAPVANAFLAGNATAGWQAEVEHGGSILETVALDDCSGVVSPPTGAGCVNGACVPDLTEAACLALGGTWQGAGTTCASVNCPPPPAPVLAVTVSGPASSTVPAPITYTVTVRNTGNAPATGTFLYAPLPSGSTFLLASAPGIYDPSRNRVAWLLGDLAPGASSTQTMTVTPTCTTSQLVQSLTYAISGSVYAYGNAVTTTMSSFGGTVTATVTATPSRVPLQEGDTIDYAFTVLAVGGDLPGAYIYGDYGAVVLFDSFTGGAGTTWQDYNGYNFRWTIDLQDGVPVQGTARVRVVGCNPSRATETALNYGNALSVRTGCGVPVAQVSLPPATPLAPPELATTLTAVGPAVPRGYGTSPFAGAVVRPGEPFPVTWEIVNVGTHTQTVTGATCSLGSLLPAGNPPFTGTVPAGTTWDAAGNRIVWSGTMAPGDTVRIRFEADSPATPACNMTISATIATANCASYASTSVPILGVPRAWTEPHLVIGHTPNRITRLRPGDTAEDPWICYGVETGRLAAIAPGGALWWMGFRSWRLDPETLELWTIDAPFLQQHNLTAWWTVAEDSTGNVYLGGAIPGGGGDLVSVVRWDPVTDTSTVIWQEQTGNVGDVTSITSMRLDGDKELAVLTPQGLVHIDLDDPAAAEFWSDPLVATPYFLLTRLPHDGEYVVSQMIFGLTPEPLVAIDPTTGAHRILVADLNAAPGAEQNAFFSMAADDSGRVYVAPGSGRLARVDPASPLPIPFVVTLSADNYSGLIWRSGNGAVSGVDEAAPPAARLTLHGAVPNPFNPRTTLAFELPRDGRAVLELFDVRGRRVAGLVDADLPAGRHQAVWTGVDEAGRAVPSGVYLARLRTAGGNLTTKLLLAR